MSQHHIVRSLFQIYRKPLGMLTDAILNMYTDIKNTVLQHSEFVIHRVKYHTLFLNPPPKLNMVLSLLHRDHQINYAQIVLM